jgi:UDP-2-acetamido-3-amino-2,3-dideoxy-glucuronate N-acetyltransferase
MVSRPAPPVEPNSYRKVTTLPFGLFAHINSFIHPTADVEDDVTVGAGTKVWHGASLRKGCRIGTNCVIGRGAFIDVEVCIGDGCKIQNNALIYAPAVVEEGVFIGPGAILTNEQHPRAVRSDGGLRQEGVDWFPEGVTLRSGCSIGAGAIIRAGVTIGHNAVVGAGAVVIHDVADFAIVAGVPATVKGVASW